MVQTNIRLGKAILLSSTLCFLVFLTPSFVFAQTTASNNQSYVTKAIVLKVVSIIPVEGTSTIPQGYNEIVTVRILEGIERGKVIEFSTSYIDGDGDKLNPGEDIFVSRYQDTPTADPLTISTYSSLDHDRLPMEVFCTIVFISSLVYFGGKQGIRALISLLGGIGCIVFILLPGVLHGYSPILLSVVLASFVATIGAYITHGFNKMTTSAIIGMVIAIIGSAIFAEIAVYFGHLSGITDENTYNLLTNPVNNIIINFQGLLLGGIIIGLLGVLYDAAIGQAVAVEELARIGPHVPRSVIYDRAYRIGKEHIGSLVNTLVLAYVGASLPAMLILLQFANASNTNTAPVLNWEFIATEIIRTTVGATGLILTIPITTWVAVRVLVQEQKTSTDFDTSTKELQNIVNYVHRH